MTRYIHGDTDAVESDRLEKQARFLTRWILDGVEAGPGARVLDLACGTGAMMRRLAARLPTRTSSAPISPSASFAPPAPAATG